HPEMDFRVNSLHGASKLEKVLGVRSRGKARVFLSRSLVVRGSLRIRHVRIFLDSLSAIVTVLEYLVPNLPKMNPKRRWMLDAQEVLAVVAPERGRCTQ